MKPYQGQLWLLGYLIRSQGFIRILPSKEALMPNQKPGIALDLSNYKNVSVHKAYITLSIR
jgi:hypothetical protein